VVAVQAQLQVLQRLLMAQMVTILFLEALLQLLAAGAGHIQVEQVKLVALAVVVVKLHQPKAWLD
jgi:hypothetical protein